jgi:hypothetical protein
MYVFDIFEMRKRTHRFQKNITPLRDGGSLESAQLHYLILMKLDLKKIIC